MSELPSIPTDDEIAHERDTTRRAILEAMQRILTGNPRLASPGSNSVLQLAVEAGVGRHQLYRSGADLRLRFERAKAKTGGGTDVERALLTKLDDANVEIKRLTQLQAETREEQKSWKNLVHLLERTINVLQEELRTEQIRAERLERQLMGDSGTASPIIPIRPRPSER